MTITDEQKKAIETIEGSVCVTAGAGTGKTLVLVERFLAIFSFLRQQGLSDEESASSILAVTFTNKAADEMRQRIEGEFRKETSEADVLIKKVYVSTIDSFCARFLRENALEIGLEPDFRIIDDFEARLLFLRKSRDILNGTGLPHIALDRWVDDFVNSIYSYMREVRNRAIPSGEFLARLSGLEDEETKKVAFIAGKIYALYEQELRKRKFFDFPGLLLESLRVLTENDRIKEKYRKQFRYVLVDEYQDTTPLQDRLLRQFSSNYFVVGDVKQSIYAFRDASPANMENFKKKSEHPLSLTGNFRSYDSILEVVNKVFEDRMEDYEPIRNRENRGKENSNEIFLGNTHEEEASFIAGRIVKMMEKGEIARLDDIVILLRGMKEPVSVYEQALRRQNIPFITTGGSGYYERGEIRDMIALLGVVNNPFDDLYLVRVMRCGIFRIKNSVIARLAGFYEQDELDDEEKSPPVKRHTLYDALARAGELDMVEDEKKTLFRLRAFIDGFLARKNACSLSRLVYGVITESNYLHYCRSLEPNERTRRLANLKKFYSLVQEFEERNVFSSLADFIAYVKEIGQQEVVESEAKIAGGDAVRIMSIHQAKGLEFRAVFVANLRERSFPSGVSSGRAMVYEETKLISDGEGKKGESGKEELRLLYVAMTRAREKLIVSGSRNAKGEMSEFMKFFMDANGRLLPPFSRLIRDMSAVSLPDWTRSVLERGCDKPQPVPSIERIKAVLFAEPRRVKSSGVVPLHFSVSQIAAYDRCPLLYKYRYFLNLPPDPGIEDESSGKTVEESVFGTVMHMVLEEHMLCAKKKQKWGKEKMKEKFSVLAKAYGVNDAEISGLYEREASHVLSSFVEDERNNADNMASLEQPFSLFFDGHEVSGVIDRIDSAEGGYRIIDYKTGRKKTAEPYVLPMRIYRMGCEKVLGYKPVKKLSLYFVRYGEMAEIGLYEGMEKDTEERVKAIIKKIGGEDFPANAAQGSCDFCDYRLLCKK